MRKNWSYMRAEMVSPDGFAFQIVKYFQSLPEALPEYEGSDVPALPDTSAAAAASSASSSTSAMVPVSATPAAKPKAAPKAKAEPAALADIDEAVDALVPLPAGPVSGPPDAVPMELDKSFLTPTKAAPKKAGRKRMKATC